MKKHLLIALLLWPLLGLLAFTGVQHMRSVQSETIIAAIKGYDPRDLLLGHYLRFQFAADADPALAAFPGAHDYYVPEADAQRLNRLLTGHDHAVTVEVRRNDGKITFGALYIDGQLWQAYLIQHPQTGQ